MKIADKVGLGAVVVIIITNPASSQFILDALDWAFQQVFQKGAPINFAASAIVMGYIFWKMWVTREKTNIPAKTSKTKAQKFVVT